PQYNGGDMPNAAVRDPQIHPRDNDLVIATHGRGIWIVDDITPLRALTADTLGKEAVFLQSKPAVARIPAFAGWVNGDAKYVGPNAPEEAVITYYQKKRHIFGDLTMEVFGADGQSLGTIPTSKRRGLSRVTWSMRLKAPRVPTAASALFSAAFGPRVVPGRYSVKMTKDKNVYTTQLRLVPDPRTTATPDDLRAQFDLSMKLYKLLNDMTYAVDRINGVRMALDDRVSKLPPNDA